MGKFYPGMIARNLNMISIYFEETGIIVLLKCFGGKNLFYANIAGIIRGTRFYDIAVQIPATMIINLLILIWLLQQVIPHISIAHATLLQIIKLKHVNFII